VEDARPCQRLFVAGQSPTIFGRERLQCRVRDGHRRITRIQRGSPKARVIGEARGFEAPGLIESRRYPSLAARGDSCLMRNVVDDPVAGSFFAVFDVVARRVP